MFVNNFASVFTAKNDFEDFQALQCDQCGFHVMNVTKMNKRYETLHLMMFLIPTLGQNLEFLQFNTSCCIFAVIQLGHMPGDSKQTAQSLQFITKIERKLF